MIGRLPGSEPYTPGDWAFIITAITTAITTCLASVAACVVAIRNGKRGEAIRAKVDTVQTRVDDVHDCLHRQAENVSALITATPGAEEAGATP